jgi:MYXO-CTERM domain-containing protein
MCMNGECVGDPNAMSTGGSGNGTGGSDVVVITGGTLNGSGASDASGGTKNAGGHPLGVTTDQKSCNCTVPGAPGSRAAALGLLALLGLARRRRRAAA